MYTTLFPYEIVNLYFMMLMHYSDIIVFNFKWIAIIFLCHSVKIMHKTLTVLQISRSDFREHKYEFSS